MARHYHELGQLFQALERAKVIVKPEKCHLFKHIAHYHEKIGVSTYKKISWNSINRMNLAL